MDTKTFFQSHVFKGILIGLGVLAILFAGFTAGQVVGWRRGDFSDRWAKNYERNFGRSRVGFLGGMMGRPGPGFMYGNGVVGPILKIDGNNLTVKDRDNTEKVVVITSQTTIVSPVGTIVKMDLKVSNNIVVIGFPNISGQVEAKFIRVLP